ncbi:hypothetical protein CCHR01_17576 [Colletotrichum chrysophilum]|uniref:Uncharacterized protein n=1 Tax=Colletotrichum chrysophilum TaxID=1836956 RepID=A0AAD9A1Q1_9PEZI|nr:hypothetical protein CCHR01_17576 [Colletotrichum chrysophilum]
MDEMEQRLTTSEASYDAQLDDIEKSAENSETSHKEKVNTMQQLIEDAKTAHREELGEKQQSMDAAKAVHDAETDKLRIRIEDTKAMYKNRVGVAQKQLNDSKATHEDKVKEMQRQIDECNTARDKDAEEHGKEIKSMRDAIEEMRNTHWAAIETEKSSHGREKQSLETTHYKEKGGYETALKNIKLEMGTLKKEHAAATHNAKEERHRLEQKATGLEDLVLILSDSKLEVERHLEEERRDAALKSSHLERLQKDLADVELQRVDVGNQLVSIEAEVQVLKESLSTEMTETAKAEESLRLANEFHTDAIFQWARLLFGPREFYSEQTLISAIGQGTQAAGHDHKPWLISESWTADQQCSEFPGHELGAVVSMLVQDLQDKVLGISVFHGLMRRLTRLVSRAPRVNTALIQWIIDHSNWSLSTVRPSELNIPARAAIWALADVLRRRWPSTGHIEDSHEVMQECWDLIAQHDPKAVDAEGLNAQGKVPMVLELLQDNNGSVIHIVKKPEWAWAVIMDMQRHTCAFVKENCLREVAMGNGIWDKEVKAGNMVIHLDMSKPECVDFYMEYWVFED